LVNILFAQAFIGGCAMSPEAGLNGFNGTMYRGEMALNLNAGRGRKA